MKTAITLCVAISMAVLSMFAPAVQAQQPERTPEPEYLFYMPYVAKQLWETGSSWTLTAFSTNDGINYYAEFTRGGWVVEGKNAQVPDNIYWLFPHVDQGYLWQDYYFWSSSSSWHPPFYIDFYAVRIIHWPDK